MATFDDIMAAAVRADKAGDTAAAQKLVAAARQMMGEGAPKPAAAEAPQQPQAVPSDPPLIPPGSAQDPNPVSAGTGRGDRFGDTIEAATRGPRQALSAYSGGLVDQSRSPTLQALPEGTPEALKRPAAFVGDLGMTALTGLGTAYAGAAGLVGETLGGDPTQEKKLARDLMMMGEVAVPQLAGVGGTVQATQKAARAASRIPEADFERQNAAAAADDLGITPSLPMTGKAASRVAATLEQTPVSAGLMADDTARFVGEVEEAFQSVVARTGDAGTARQAGEKLQGGLERFVTDFKSKSSELFGQVDVHIPPETQVTSPQTVQLIRDTLKSYEGNPEIASQLGLDKWANLADGLEQGLSWQAARDLRSQIGESIGKINGPLKDMDQGRLSRVYGSLTDDLGQIAKDAGEDADKAWRRAQRYYRRGAERISEGLDKSIKPDSPERAFEAFAAMAKDGRSTSDIKRMRRIKASLRADEWADLSASLIERMGSATPGRQNAAGEAFSPVTFLTEWSKIGPEAKSILVNSETREEINKLAKVIEGFREAGGDRNFSNTGSVAANIATGGALTAAPVTTLSTLAGVHITARAMTSRPFLRAMNKMAKGDTRQMQRIANSDNPLSADAKTLMQLTAAQSATEPAAANITTRPVIQASR